MRSDDDPRYDVQLTGTARRDLSHTPPRIVPAVIEFVYGELTRHPTRVGKPLRRAFGGLFSARRGPYRVFYRVDEDSRTIFILRVDHRGEVYRPR